MSVRDKTFYQFCYIQIQSFIIISMKDKKSTFIVALISLLFVAQSVYIPQLQLCASTDFLNRQLKTYGPTIQKQLDQAKIPDITYDDKFDGVAVKFNLTNIKQKFGINWNANVIKVQDEHSFTLYSKNVNLTLHADIQFKISVAVKQKGTLVIEIDKMETDTTLGFTQPHCVTQNQEKGLGFDVQIQKLYLNTEKISIKIEGKGIDNLIIKAVMSVLKSRLPSMIQKIALEKGNPAISQITCSPIHQLFGLGSQSYIAIVNTTNVPHFIGSELYAEIDLTFVNSVSNKTNDEVENDHLPQQNLFETQAEISLLVSSNMMNSILWLIDDSKVLSLNITNDMLGPNPPIQLNTLNLSILIPGLSKWKRKEVILVVEPASKFSHLYIRNGKLVAALSMSIKFVVNNTGYEPQPVKTCIAKGHCITAVDLNATIPFAAAVHVDSGNVLRGLVHTVAVQQIETIASEIQVKTEQLKKILNTMIGSFRPQINKLIQAGIPLDISALEKYEVDKVLMATKKDYAAIGIGFKK